MHIFDLTCTELADEMKRRYGKGFYHAAALYREIFKKGSTAVADAPEFVNSRALARQLSDNLQLPSCRIVALQDDGGVIKFASALSDGCLIESVIIPAHGRTTLCVSSQVGCKRRCTFCVTGEMGFVRDLTVEEIVWQVYAARFKLNHQIDNIVFMGMGEPLDNFDNVLQAVRVMSDQRGLDIAYSHITISTAGHADAIRQLASRNLYKLRLAVSLNAADDELRSELMPINRQYPLGRLKEELLKFPLEKNGIIFVEYVLLAGVNDSCDDAMKLVRYLEGLAVRVNVIVYNTGRAATYAAPDREQAHRFCQWLAEAKLFVRLRQPRGECAMAACGQLGASLGKRATI
jgi:23S rRNA (adenine2503-C2)-methyltransferase